MRDFHEENYLFENRLNKLDSVAIYSGNPDIPSGVVSKFSQEDLAYWACTLPWDAEKPTELHSVL